NRFEISRRMRLARGPLAQVCNYLLKLSRAFVSGALVLAQGLVGAGAGGERSFGHQLEGPLVRALVSLPGRRLGCFVDQMLGQVVRRRGQALDLPPDLRLTVLALVRRQLRVLRNPLALAQTLLVRAEVCRDPLGVRSHHLKLACDRARDPGGIRTDDRDTACSD